MPSEKEVILISIIVPCYKVEKYLPKCLDSLVSQTLENIEIICINDGSPDHCIDILREYEANYPGKVVVIDKQNEGVWKGRRDGIAIARGQYIGFVDSDDYVAPNYCELLYRSAAEENSDIAVCGFYRIEDGTGKKLTTEMSDERKPFDAQETPARLLELNGAPWNKIFRASLLKNLPDLAHPPRIFDDMMMHLLTYPRVKRVSFTPYALVYYIIRDNSIMTTINTEQLNSTYRAMLEVKASYQQQQASKGLMDFLAAAAFLHFGISLMFRMSYDPRANMSELLKQNRAYLDERFPTWKDGSILSLPNALRYGRAVRKTWFMRLAYKAHLMNFALKLYRFMIEKMGKDIKW